MGPAGSYSSGVAVPGNLPSVIGSIGPTMLSRASGDQGVVSVPVTGVQRGAVAGDQLVDHDASSQSDRVPAAGNQPASPILMGREANSPNTGIALDVWQTQYRRIVWKPTLYGFD